MQWIGIAPAAQSVPEGSKAADPGEMIADGYYFRGWYKEAAGTNAFDFSSAITDKTVIYAKWSKSSYKVTFKFNNGSSDEVKYVAQGGKAEAPAEPARENYSFGGWFADADATVPFDFGADITEETTIYAGWNKTAATLVFNYNYVGAPESKTYVVKLDEVFGKLDEIETVRERYEFVGWFTDKTCSPENEVDFSSVITGDITVYAKWVKSEYEIEYKANGGVFANEKISVSIVYNVNDQLVPPEANPVRTGYDFTGWYITETASGEPFDFTAAVKDDMSLFAGWALHVYTLTFNYNYTGAPETVEMQAGYNTSVTLAEPTREGYDFGGWYENAEGTGNEFIVGGETPTLVTKDADLYANWIQKAVQVQNWTVTFSFNLPDVSDPYHTSTVKDNTSVTKPADPVKEGYYFGGWYSDAACTTEYNFASRIKDNVTIYAQMLKIHTFEAEFTDLVGKGGQGSSVNYYETGLVKDYSFIGDGTNKGESFVSNGYFILGLYYTGAFLEFEIDAKEEVNNAILAFRVSSEGYLFSTDVFDWEEIQVIVNGTYDENEVPLTGIIQHDGLYIPPAYGGAQGMESPTQGDIDVHKTPFVDSIVYTKLHL
ncbi:MAG: InlB B-repeat-containing protein, partial [Clostridia bacterium]|nr:InlB B-repeat-containing protein [Clostridia bacterium]